MRYRIAVHQSLAKIPGVNRLDAVRALQKAGFAIARQGKHIVKRKNPQKR